jgi:hypothetical protein
VLRCRAHNANSSDGCCHPVGHPRRRVRSADDLSRRRLTTPDHRDRSGDEPIIGVLRATDAGFLSVSAVSSLVVRTIDRTGHYWFWAKEDQDQSRSDGPEKINKIGDQ